MVAEAQGMGTHWFCRYMLLQWMIPLKQENQMKNREIPVLDNRNIFPMRYGRASDVFCRVCGTCLNFLYVRSHCVQTQVASNKHISQTRKVNEKPKIPILDDKNIFPMSYRRASETIYASYSISLKLWRHVDLQFVYCQVFVEKNRMLYRSWNFLLKLRYPVFPEDQL